MIKLPGSSELLMSCIFANGYVLFIYFFIRNLALLQRPSVVVRVCYSSTRY